MLCVVSPAKSLDFEGAPAQAPQTRPVFADEAARLARTASRLSKAKLKAMMDLSDALTDLNYQRFKAFEAEPAPTLTKPAAHAFAGDTYIGLDFPSLPPRAQTYAQDHLAILSGLYGVLRPYDGIQPYRLEMGRRLKTRRGETLYDFWGKTIAAELRARAEETGATCLVNCASQEYFRAVDTKALGLPVITPVFEDEKDGVAKVIGFFAKRARGAMARFMVETRARSAQDLHGFAWEGYAFQPDLSAPNAPVFRRSAQMAA
ncbi:MAG: peroxide stress protein YaaA [Pseudomonadota bacterium]